MSSSLVSQDVGPMVIGYGLVMGALALGLRIIRRKGPASLSDPEPRPGLASRPRRGPVARPGPVARARSGLRVVARFPPGWPRLIAHCAITAVGGYLLLMIVIVLYYYLVAPIAGNFVASAFTGCLLLVGLSVPVFLALSWLAERKRWRI